MPVFEPGTGQDDQLTFQWLEWSYQIQGQINERGTGLGLRLTLSPHKPLDYHGQFNDAGCLNTPFPSKIS